MVFFLLFFFFFFFFFSSESWCAGDDVSSASVATRFFSDDAAERAVQEVLAGASALRDVGEQLMVAWRAVRVTLVAPVLKLTMFLCLALIVMILVEKMALGVICLAVKVFRLKPEWRYKWEAVRPDPEAAGDSAYPMVLIQIPMYNEKEVYKLSIGAACSLEWPTERLIVQVLDDSTDRLIQELVEAECEKWKRRGMRVHYAVRESRKGYKAGALREGMKRAYVRECEYMAVFDADFQPDPDFLARTIPFLVHNPEIALVQARWKFVNADECMLTRMQEMSLDYHFKIEQEAGSSTFAFFGFNGTAGVWRISTLEAAGGWQDRTTVEDMDLAVRASLQGWKFVYVGDVKVKSELPSTFQAYRHQQYRWSCGPANLFKKMAGDIIVNEACPSFNLICSHRMSNVFDRTIHPSLHLFGRSKRKEKRQIVAHTTTFVFYCVVIPTSVLVPEVDVPLWGVVSVPTLITIFKAFGTPSSLHLLVFWILFENVMSLHRIKAALAGLMGSRRVNEWIVTEKSGSSSRAKPSTIEEGEVNQPGDDATQTNGAAADEGTHKPPTRFSDRFHFTELMVGLLLALVGCYDVAFKAKGYFVYLFLQSIAFFVAGFSYVGK